MEMQIMTLRATRILLLAGISCLAVTAVRAQQAAQPAGQGALPEVEVIQKKAPVAAPKAAAKKAPAKKAPIQPVESDYVQDAPAESNSPYGAANSGGAKARAENAATGPVNPSNILPGNLEQFSSAGSRVDTAQVEQFQPRQTNDVFARVPGVNVINDDGFGRHGGIGVRGSPPRRGRKVLTLEDGQPINMSVWIDPSVHYVPPIDRLESIEVLKGAVFNQGPLNNHGVVNFRNLSPFGPNETVIGASIGFTEDGAKGVSNTRHVHTRQGIGNVGVVLSYSGAEADGAWDLERLRYNDFYGAIGFKGINSDLTFSAVHFRQRDNYDEANIEGEEGDGEGNAERLFFETGHKKSLENPGARFNTYNADVTKLQLLHNYYVDDTTTITSRVYGFDHRRDRYQNFEGEDPSEADGDLAAEIDGDEVFVPEGVMLGRLRTYRQLGAEVRAEFADRPLIGGLRQDIQTGIRYEYNDFTNKNFFGAQGQILEDGDETGTTVFDTDTDSRAISAFLQTTIHLTSNFTATPGLRFEHYKVSRLTKAATEEEGEGEEIEDDESTPGVNEAQECEDAFGVYVEECVEIGGYSGARSTDSFDKTHVLPGVAFAYTGFKQSTVYASYHRGLTTQVLREAIAGFPPEDEIGDNFQIGLRSTAIRGLTFDIAAFHNKIDNYQVKGAGTDASGNNVYHTMDEVEINGIEVYGRVDSRPFTASRYNFFFEGNYTLSDAKIKKGTLFSCDDDDPMIDCDDPANLEAESVNGNRLPESYKHFANLTVGVEHPAGWDASVTWTYRGNFYTDEENTPYGGDEEGEDGLVPDVWLLSARANYHIPNSGVSLFVAGDNLLNELYIADREDGIKAGQGRTIWTGFKYKF
jgi:Fe(3+) dicitrate transport protein